MGVYVLVAALAAAAVEPASVVERDAKNPEQLWKRAAGLREAGARDRSQYRACAEHFEAVAQQLGADHPRAAEALYEAARCHEAGGAVGAALRIDEQLAEKHRDAELGKLALAAVGRDRLALLRFAGAAEAFEAYAARYPAGVIAPGLLLDAAGLRSELGMYEQAQRDLEQIEKSFSRSAPSAAARAFWARRELLPASYATDAARRAHAEEFLRKYGAADAVLELRAIAAIAEIDWRASCKIGKQKQPGPLGLCIELKYEQPTLCDVTATQVVVHPRDRKLADAAVAGFQKVLAASRGFEAHAQLYEPGLKDAVRLANIRLADRDLEAYLDVHVPEDLSFAVEEWRQDSPAAGDRARYEKQVKKRADSQRRFMEFYAQKTKLAAGPQKAYELLSRSREDGSVALTRVSLLALDYADEVMQSNPDLPPGPQARQILCEALEERVEPQVAYAMQALSACVTSALVYGEFDESARYCEAELQRRVPPAFPPLRELFAEMQALDPGEPEAIGLQVEPYGFGEQ